MSFEEVNQSIWDIECDVFMPCAASRLVELDHVKRLLKSGVELIASGANVPFSDKEIFYGSIAEYADNNLSLVPDFISNCGMARVFAYLMEKRRLELTDKDIFIDCSDTILRALQDCYNQSQSKLNIASTALEISLNKLLKQ